MTSLKAILIDLDGTLADSIPALYKAYLTFMEEKGEIGTEEEFNHLNGPAIHEVIKFLKPKYGWNDSNESLFKRYSETIKKIFSSNLVLFPGVKEFLHYVKIKEIKLALVTSAESDLAMPFLKSNEIDKYFDVVVTSDDVDKNKPNPEIYLRALELLGIQPDEAWAIEDSYNGVSAALKANILTFQIMHQSKTPFVKGAKQVSNWAEITKMVTTVL